MSQHEAAAVISHRLVGPRRPPSVPEWVGTQAAFDTGGIGYLQEVDLRRRIWQAECGGCSRTIRPAREEVREVI